MGESEESFTEWDYLMGINTVESESSETTISVTSAGHEFRMTCYLSILNECLEQLSLLERILKAPVDTRWKNLVPYKTIEERFGPNNEQLLDVTGYDYLTETQKFQREVCYVATIIYNQFNSILNDENDFIIKNAVHIDEKLKEDEEGLMFERDVNCKTVTELKQLYEKEKHHFEKTIQEKKSELFRCKERYEDNLIYCNYEDRYTAAWENSRIDQKEKKVRQTEGFFIKQINEYRNKIDHEERIHTEIVTYIDTNTDDMLDAVKYWQKLYEQERENRDQELYTVKMNKERLVQDLEILRQTSIQHKEAVDAWLKIKEDRRQAENQRKKELEAASKIQSWWRGIMVRKKLGPYKKKAKKRGKGKGKKK